MVRDPRDVLLSQKGKWRQRFTGKRVPLQESLRTWANYHPIVISKLWNSTVRTADKHAMNQDMIVVRFEDLLNNPETEVSRICKFLGIAYDNEMLNVRHGGSSNVSVDINKRGISPSVSGRWKNGLNSTEVYWCQRINHLLMKKFGYECNHVSPNVLSLITSLLSLPFKLCLSLLLNVSRTKNIFLAIKRRLM